MQLHLLSLALNMALLARIASGEKDSDGDELPPGLPKVSCDGDFLTYAQCVWFESDNDPRGTYNKDLTKKACAAYPHDKYPPFEFFEDDKACVDEQGVGDDTYRRICSTDFAGLCFDLGGGYNGKAAYGANMGETLKEMYSYADEGDGVTSDPQGDGTEEGSK